MKIYLLMILSFFFIFNMTLALQPQIKWRFDIKDNAYGQAAAADLDKDGKLEIVFSTYRNDGYIYVLNAEDGSLLWS